MENKKQVLQGIDDFKKLLTNNGYYVDKTLLVKDLLDRPDEIVLITRPRRFGKTLNMSMLKYFIEIPECRKFEGEIEDVGYLFEGLKIFDEEKYRKIQGTYPVIFLTFKSAKQDDWESTYNNINYIIANEYSRHRYILESNILSDFEKSEYERIMNLNASIVEYTNVIIHLSTYLKRLFKKECMVFIDEYDTPIQAGYLNGYFKEIIGFAKSMLEKGLKGNKALKQGVVTGIMKVAQESIFSDFNNPMVATILTERFNDSFGFTEAEVEEMTKYFNLESKLDDIKSWYNGYIFGLNTVIYNPWSIIKFISSPLEGFKSYWINTSDNKIIQEVMQLDKKEGKEVVEKLIKGEEVRKVVEENIVYQSIKENPNVAWSFLLHAGYLKAYDRKTDSSNEKFEYRLEIPNTGVRTIYKDMIINYFKDDAKVSNELESIINCLFKGDIEKFARIFKELYVRQVSYFDTPVKKGLSEVEQDNRFENFHHGFMLGTLMFAMDKYFVFSNKEYGLGRPDIVLIPRDVEKTAYIFEFKWESTRGKKTLNTLAENALHQIIEEKYFEGVQKVHGLNNIILVGVGFKGKLLKMIVK